MSSVQPSPDATPEPPQPVDPAAQDLPDEPQSSSQPPNHERWWWTGTYRAVLGGAVVGYQWPVLSSGDAGTWNWVVAAVGAAVVVWGLSIVLAAYRSRREGDVR